MEATNVVDRASFNSLLSTTGWPDGRVRSSREARHLIRTLRLRLAKVGEELLGAGELPEDEDDPVNRETCQAVPGRPGSQNYAPSA